SSRVIRMGSFELRINDTPIRSSLKSNLDFGFWPDRESEQRLLRPLLFRGRADEARLHWRIIRLGMNPLALDGQSISALPRYFRPQFSPRSQWRRQSRWEGSEQCSQSSHPPSPSIELLEVSFLKRAIRGVPFFQHLTLEITRGAEHEPFLCWTAPRAFFRPDRRF